MRKYNSLSSKYKLERLRNAKKICMRAKLISKYKTLWLFFGPIGVLWAGKIATSTFYPNTLCLFYNPLGAADVLKIA